MIASIGTEVSPQICPDEITGRASRRPYAKQVTAN